MVNGTLGTLEEDETGRGAPTKQHRSSPDCPGPPGQQLALADDESPRLAKLAIHATPNNAYRSQRRKQQNPARSTKENLFYDVCIHYHFTIPEVLMFMF